MRKLDRLIDDIFQDALPGGLSLEQLTVQVCERAARSDDAELNLPDAELARLVKENWDIDQEIEDTETEFYTETERVNKRLAELGHSRRFNVTQITPAELDKIYGGRFAETVDCESGAEFDAQNERARAREALERRKNLRIVTPSGGAA